MYIELFGLVAPRRITQSLRGVDTYINDYIILVVST